MLPFDDANAVSHLVGKGESSPINTTIDMLLYILFVLYAHRTVVSPIDWLEVNVSPRTTHLQQPQTGNSASPGMRSGYWICVWSGLHSSIEPLITCQARVGLL